MVLVIVGWEIFSTSAVLDSVPYFANAVNCSSSFRFIISLPLSFIFLCSYLTIHFMKSAFLIFLSKNPCRNVLYALRFLQGYFVSLSSLYYCFHAFLSYFSFSENTSRNFFTVSDNASFSKSYILPSICSSVFRDRLFSYSLFSSFHLALNPRHDDIHQIFLLHFT